MALSYPPRVLRLVLFAAANAVLLAISVYGVVSLRSYPGLGLGWSGEDRMVVVGTLHPDSDPYRAGMRRGDVISRVDNLAATPAGLEVLLLDRAPGDSVTLASTHEGQVRSIPIALTTRHSAGLTVVSSILGILFWAVAVFVYVKRSGEYASRVFAWTMILLGATIMMVWPGYPQGGALLGFAPPLLYLVAYSQIPAGILLFFLVYPRRKAVLPQRTAALLFIPAAFFGCLLCVNYLRAIAFRSIGEYEGYLRCYGFFRIYLAISLLLSLTALLHSRLCAQTRADRNKVQWILWGIVVGAFPFVALWSLPQALGHSPVIPEEAAYVFMMVIPVAFAFSIVRYRALDIEVIVSRGIGYAVVSGLIVALYLGIVGLAGIAIHSTVTKGGRVILVACTLLAAVAFAPLRRRVQDIVDRTFYRTRYNYRIAMQDLGIALKAARSSRAAFTALREKALRAIPIGTLAVSVCDHGVSPVTVLETEGLDAPGCNVLTSFLQSLPCSDPPLPEGIRNLGIDLVLSIGIQGKTLGYIAAGRRLSGGSFTDDDTDLLRAMAEEAFMAAERHRLQESVILEHAAAEKLGELNRLKSGFIAHVSHELRTPLTSIRWSVENLLDGIPEPCSPRVREYLVGIHESSLHLAHMIENLLNSTRIDAARLDLLLENVDVCRAVKAATDVVRPVAEKKQIVLRTSCAEGLALVADAHGVQTILINLVDNAVKYSPGGAAVTVEARQARPGDDLPFCTSGVVLAVKDEGTGIPSDRLGSIFDPFERVRSEKTTGERGLGLGLHIVKQLVTQLGGHITVESTLGIGSTFTVVLPQATPKA